MLQTLLTLVKGFFFLLGGLLGLGVLFFLTKALWKRSLVLSQRRQEEILGGFLLLLGLLLLVSLLSYSPFDLSNIGHESIQNFGGIIGVHASQWLFHNFGLFSFLLPLFLFLWGWNRIRSLEMDTLILQSLLVLGLVLLLSPFYNLLNLFLPLPEGVRGFEITGALGSKLSQFLLKFFGKVGSPILLFSLILILLSGEEKVRSFYKILFHLPKKFFTRVRLPKLSPHNLPVETEKPINKERRRRHRPSPTPIPREEVLSLEEDLDEEALPPPIEAMSEKFQERFLEILKDPKPLGTLVDKDEIENNIELLKNKLLDFGVGGEVVNVSSGPVITRYEFQPAPGIKVSRIASLSDDLALAMKAERIRIVAPIPGKAAVGIEIPNQKRQDVFLKDTLTSEIFTSSMGHLTVALGKDIAGDSQCADIARMPHLLVAGATGSGKSVAINTMVASILYRSTPQDVRFLMIDPKRLELPVYNGVPHLIGPVITEPKDSLNRLREVIYWMEERYREFARAGVRDIEGFNERAPESKRKPYILVIVDELADLMITVPTDIEEVLTRLAQMSRAVGIHLILATQRPSVDVITGLIKANFPARIAFQVASKTDSRTILDMNGAEKLLGRGDMLFIPPGKGEPVRLHGAFISTQEAKEIAKLWSGIHLSDLLKGKIPKTRQIVSQIEEEDFIEPIVNRKAPERGASIRALSERIQESTGIPADDLYSLLYNLEYYPPIYEETPGETKEEGEELITVEDEADDLFKEAKELVIRHQIASVSLLQRRLKIGYARAGRLIDQLEKAGVVGPFTGSKAREVLINREGIEVSPVEMEEE